MLSMKKNISEEKIQKSYIALSLMHEVGHIYFADIISGYDFKEAIVGNLDNSLKNDFFNNLKESFADTFAIMVHDRISEVNKSFCSSLEAFTLLKYIREEFNNKFKLPENQIKTNDIKYLDYDYIQNKEVDFKFFVNKSFCASFVNTKKLLEDIDKKNEIKESVPVLQHFSKIFFNLEDVDMLNDAKKLYVSFGKNDQVQKIATQINEMRNFNKNNLLNKVKL